MDWDTHKRRRGSSSFSPSKARAALARIRRIDTRTFLAATFLLQASVNVMAPNLTKIAEALGLDNLQRDELLGGAMSTAYFLVGAPASIFVGILTDVVDRKRLFTGVAIGAALVILITGVVEDIWSMLVLRAALGALLGGVQPILFSIFGDLFPPSQRAGVSSVVGLTVGGGTLIGQLLSGFIGGRFGWRAPYLLIGLLSICSAFLLHAFAIEPPRGGADRQEEIPGRDSRSMSMSSNYSPPRTEGMTYNISSVHGEPHITPDDEMYNQNEASSHTVGEDRADATYSSSDNKNRSTSPPVQHSIAVGASRSQDYKWEVDEPDEEQLQEDDVPQTPFSALLPPRRRDTAMSMESLTLEPSRTHMEDVEDELSPSQLNTAASASFVADSRDTAHRARQRHQGTPRAESSSLSPDRSTRFMDDEMNMENIQTKHSNAASKPISEDDLDVDTSRDNSVNSRLNLRLVKRLLQIKTNALIFSQALPGTIPWGIITVYLHDYFMQEQGFSAAQATFIVMIFAVGSVLGGIGGGIVGQKIYNSHNFKHWLPVAVGVCQASATLPVLFLINWRPPIIADEHGEVLDDVQLQMIATQGVNAIGYDGYGIGLTKWSVYIAAGISGLLSSATGPNMKAMLLNVNTPSTRGSVFTLMYLFDSIGKGVGPAAVAAGIRILGGRVPCFNLAIMGWLASGLLTATIFTTMSRDEAEAKARIRASNTSMRK